MREDGVIIVSDPGRDRPVEEKKTFQCVHCGCHFELMHHAAQAEFLRAGCSVEEMMRSLHRGWCAKYDGPICGGPGCVCDEMPVHRHFMDRIEQIEANQRSELWTPAAYHFQECP